MFVSTRQLCQKWIRKPLKVGWLQGYVAHCIDSPAYICYTRALHESSRPLEVLSIAKELKVNEQIRARQVRLIMEDGQQQGIVDTRDALRMAREAELDLVLVGEQAQPPVAKLLDYGKYRYEMQQQEKEARKRSRQQEMKAIKFRVKIDDHDYNTKVNHVKRFLKGGHKVKVTIMFRGRERTHPELGQEILNRVASDVSDMATVESAPSIAGMDMNMVLGPAKEASA